MNQKVTIDLPKGITLEIKREDLLHPFISGNKFRKMKYNLLQAQKENKQCILTFGGAYSNHIAAVAYAGTEYGLKTIGVIRGDELAAKIETNPTLRFAAQQGMQFEFVSREQYRNKSQEAFIEQLRRKYGDFYLLPEGGTNQYAVQGCQEILSPEDAGFDYICCAVGTGGTIAGIINSSFPHQKVLGFPALKGNFLTDEIRKFASNQNWELVNDYHFGGYGKVSEALIDFINRFFWDTNIPLDPIYTGKMVFGVMDLIQKDYFEPNSRIVVIHSGGLQGIEGMNALLKSKNKTLIAVK